MSETTLDATGVLARARREGQAWVDGDVAARIVAGAAPAMLAVETARQSLQEPCAATSATFAPTDAERAGAALLAVLESLAADGE